MPRAPLKVSEVTLLAGCVCVSVIAFVLAAYALVWWVRL